MKTSSISSLFLAMLLTIAAACRQSNHVVVGKWEAGDIKISFYGDGMGSFNGQKMKWQSIDGATVRMELEDEFLEFSTFRLENGDLTGSLVLGGTEVRDFLHGDKLAFKKTANR